MQEEVRRIWKTVMKRVIVLALLDREKDPIRICVRLLLVYDLVRLNNVDNVPKRT